MSFGTAKSWRLSSPFVALFWAAVTVGFAGAAQAADSDGTDHHSSVVTSASSDAGSPRATPTLPPQATDHPSGRSGGGASGGGGSTGGSSGGSSGGTASDAVTPQPISNADANTVGANGQCSGGPYCSTTDGTPSANGNGGGTATGKPCAGCVGKADNKNPHGQMPGPSDSNAGYECDTNHGIAKGNPAHSGCQQAPEQGCVPTATVPCVPCIVTAQNPCGPPPPACVPTTAEPCVPSPPSCVTGCVSPPIAGEAAPNTSAVVSAPQEVLPNTGAPAGLVLLAASALASILAGAYLLRRGRRAPLTRT